MRNLNRIINHDETLFALDLRYNTPGSSDALTAGERYNGNISEMRWDAGTPKGYGFAYDGLNRLTAADYAEGSSFTGNTDYYNTSYTYDKNGNIDLLNRNRGTKIDGLDYTYDSNEKSNRLLSVTDAGTTEGYRAIGGTYQYDSNGNLTTDPSKGTTISYNMLNLPEEVGFGANDNVRYTYDAAGNKRIKVVEGINAENNTRVDYSGNFLYENNDLKAIFTSAGRIVPFNNNGEVLYKFEYNLQDHLGNTRVVFSGHSNGQPEVMQVTDYYPFGLVMNQQNYFADGVLDNKYLYNGKELQDDELAGNNLGWYDYGARMYDPALGRFHTQDRFSEKYYSLSNYQYAANNPILNIDVNGDSIRINYGNNQELLYTPGMKYSGNDKFVSQTVDYLNNINSVKGGNKLIGKLNSSTDDYNFINKTPVDKKGNQLSGTFQFKGNSNDGGGTILAGEFKNSKISGFAKVEGSAHELFHGYQHGQGQGGASIMNEFEAHLFGFTVAEEWAYSSNYIGALSGTNMGTNTPTGSAYETAFNNLQSGFSLQDYKTGVKSFVYGYQKGYEYKNRVIQRANQKKVLIKSFYPLR